MVHQMGHQRIPVVGRKRREDVADHLFLESFLADGCAEHVALALATLFDVTFGGQVSEDGLDGGVSDFFFLEVQGAMDFGDGDRFSGGPDDLHDLVFERAENGPAALAVKAEERHLLRMLADIGERVNKKTVTGFLGCVKAACTSDAAEERDQAPARVPTGKKAYGKVFDTRLYGVGDA